MLFFLVFWWEMGGWYTATPAIFHHRPWPSGHWVSAHQVIITRREAANIHQHTHKHRASDFFRIYVPNVLFFLFSIRIRFYFFIFIFFFWFVLLVSYNNRFEHSECLGNLSGIIMCVCVPNEMEKNWFLCILYVVAKEEATVFFLTNKFAFNIFNNLSDIYIHGRIN